MKEYTIKEAAEILEVSTSTVRRRIKSGKIEAELKASPYGEQYYIPKNELNQAVKDKEVVDVKDVSKPIDKEQFLNELTDAVNANLSGDMEKVEDNIKESMKRQNEQLQEEIQALSEKVDQLQQQQNKNLWDKIKNIFR